MPYSAVCPFTTGLFPCVELTTAAALLGQLLLTMGCGDGGKPTTVNPIAWATPVASSIYEQDRPLEVAIEVTPGNWEQLRVDGRSMAAILAPTPTAFEYAKFSATVHVEGVEYRNVEIRKKGFIGSLSTLRPSLKLDFGAQVGIDEAEARRLTLNNDLQDPSHVRQCLSYRLFNQVGIPAPRCAYAHVVVNGNDLGIYTSVEPIRKRMLERFFDDASGQLYEGTLADLTVESVDRVEAKRPAPGADREDLAGVVAALAAADDQVMERLEAVVDLDRFRTFWALETLLGHWDGYSGNANNYYIYSDPTSGKLVFLPWGTDQVFVGRPNFNDDPYEPTGYAHGALSRRLYDLPEQRAAFKQRLEELLAELWQPELLLETVDELVELASETNQTALAELKEHIRTHGRTVLAALQGPLPEVPLRAAPSPDSCANTTSDISGSFDLSFSLTGSNAGQFAWQGSLDGQSVDVNLTGIVVGDDANPDAVVVLGLGDISGRGATTGFILPKSSLLPGVHPFHSFESFGFVNVLDPEAGEEVGVGLIGDGKLTVVEGSTQLGQPITATFTAQLFQSQCVNW